MILTVICHDEGPRSSASDRQVGAAPLESMRLQTFNRSSPVSNSSQPHASETREPLIHVTEHVSASARAPQLCHSCALFPSQLSGSEKVGTLTCLPLIPMLQPGVTLAHLKLCVCVRERNPLKLTFSGCGLNGSKCHNRKMCYSS